MSDKATTEKERVPFWLWPNVLGLDAPLVAVAWQYFFAAVFHLKIPTSNYVVLGLVVWAIYSADRLLDSQRLQAPDRAALRHRFYRHHFVPLALLTAFAAVAALYGALTQIPVGLLRLGLMLSGLVSVYFIHRVWVKGPMLLILPKEIFTGMVFAVGATMAGNVWSSEIPEGLWSAEVLTFGLLCSLNCLAISVWERGSDEDNDPNAVAQLWPEMVGGFPVIAWGAAAAACGFAAWGRTAAAFPVFCAVAIGAVTLAVLASLAAKMRPQSLRALADAAVLLPAVALLPALPWISTF